MTLAYFFPLCTTDESDSQSAPSSRYVYSSSGLWKWDINKWSFCMVSKRHAAVGRTHQMGVQPEFAGSGSHQRNEEEVLRCVKGICLRGQLPRAHKLPSQWRWSVVTRMELTSKAWSWMLPWAWLKCLAMTTLTTLEAASKLRPGEMFDI